MGPKFERIKNRKGWNWKKFVILYIIQNKKNSNQKDMDQIWRKKKLKELVWNFKGFGVEFEDEREKKKKKNINGGQTKLEEHFGACATPLQRGCWDLPNTTMESCIW